jgi:hypothetical protein
MRLRETQRRMAALLMTPMTPADRIARKTLSGVATAREATALIKPNDRLTSLERLEIYSRSYWFRLLDALRDDFQGMIALLGTDRFDRLATAYLSDCPSRSFTLRDLGSGLPAWLERNPKYAGRHGRLALDMARLEWAHIVAFDGPAEKVLGPENLLKPTPGLRLGLQPYISLLDLQYPVDEMRVKLKTVPEEAKSASNVAVKKKARVVRKIRTLKSQPLYLAVHRLEASVYYRRLALEEFRLLTALRAGRTIANAIRVAFQESSVAPQEIPDLLKTWFARWAEFGWLSPRFTATRIRRGVEL